MGECVFRGLLQDYFRAVIILCLTLMLITTACTGKSNTIEGDIPPGLITGGAISCFTLDGELLAQGAIDSAEHFSLNADQKKSGDGFVLQITEGTIFGESISGTMGAIYGPTDDRTAANVTLMTSLVKAHAERLAQDGLNLVVARAQTLDLMTELGMLNGADWSSVNPSVVNAEGLMATMTEAGGVAQWTSALIQDLDDQQLSEVYMPAFPQANGGVLRLNLTRDCMPETVVSVPVAIASALDPVPAYRYELVTPSLGLFIDKDTGTLTLTNPDQHSGDAVPFTMRITNPTTGLYRDMTDHFYVMSLETVIEGTVGSQGRTLYDTWDEMSLIVAPGTVPLETVFRIVRGLGEDGNTYSLQTVPDNVTLATAPKLTFSGFSNREAAAQSPQEQTKSDGEWSEWTKPTYPHFLSIGAESSLADRLWCNRVPTGKTIGLNILQRQITSYKQEAASSLYSLCGNRESFSGSACAGRSPVLFVHGFTLDPEELGGGPKTWGQFPELLHTAGLSVFEFRYRSAARFEDIATDLGAAITEIQSATGKKAHIVAHSFGGLVARTYIQGLSQVPYGDNVESLVTLGTPHSGVFGSSGVRHAVLFPKGTDTKWWTPTAGTFINKGLMSQISVHEAGGDIGPYKLALLGVGLSIDECFDVSPDPGETVANLSDTMSSYPSTVPTLALLGLKANGSTYTNGDGLISYAGQRFDPGLSVRNNAETLVLLSDRHLDNASGYQLAPTIYEKILYFPQYALPGQTVPSAYAGHSGYGHNARLGGTFPEAFVAATNAAPSTVAQPTPEVGKKYHYGYLEVRNWLATHTGTPMLPSKVSVRVHVLDAATSLGIEGVSVQAFVADTPIGPLGQTNDNGYATLDVPFISNSAYAITFLANGYKTLSKERAIVTQSTNAGTVVELGDTFMQPQLPGRGSLVGTILDRTAGAALADAQCALSNGVRTFNTYTAADGRYQIEDISAGTWSLTVSMNGYRNTQQTVVIRSGEVTEALVRMTSQTQNITTPTVRNYDPDYYKWVGNTSAYMAGHIVDDGGNDISEAFIGYGKQSDGSDWIWHEVTDPYREYTILVQNLDYGSTYYCQTAAANLSFPDTWGRGTKYSFYTSSTRNRADLASRINRFVPSGILYAGTTYRLLDSIVNIGDTVAGATHAKCYISTDNDRDVSDDHYLGEFDVNSLGPGEETWIQHDFVMPALRTGTYDFWLVTLVDVYDDVAELNDSNFWKTMDDGPWRASGSPAAKLFPVSVDIVDMHRSERCYAMP